MKSQVKSPQPKQSRNAKAAGVSSYRQGKQNGRKQQATIDAEKPKLIQSTKQLIAETIKQQKSALQDKQRYQFSPTSKQFDQKKNAWERLLERSFDPKTVEFVRQFKSQQNSQAQTGNKPKPQHYQTAVQSPKNSSRLNNARSPDEVSQISTCMSVLMEHQLKNNLRNFNDTMSQSNLPSNPISHIHSGDNSRVVSPRNTTKQESAWKELMDKTSDCKPEKTQANHSTRRTLEQFLSGRTVNPQKYAAQANLLMISDEKKRERLLQSPDQSIHSITGCRRKSNPKVHQHNFKVAYTIDELNSCLTPPPVDNQQKRDRSRSNRSHFKEGMSLNETAAVYLGSTSQKVLIQEKRVKENLAKQIKNQLDYGSKVACLKPEQTMKDKAQNNYNSCRSLSQQKFRNLISTLNTDVFTHPDTDKDINQSYRRRQATQRLDPHPMFTKSAQILIPQKKLERPTSARGRKIPEGAKNMFESQLTRLS